MNTSEDFYFDVERPQQLSRLLIFVKWLLIMPHLFVLYFYSLAAGVVYFLAWFVVLFTGQYPQGMWNFVYAYQRWNARVTVYSYLLRDEYPPFGEAPYPMVFDLEYPRRSSRLLLIGRFFLIIPLAIWLVVLGIIEAFLLIYAWFAILVTGNIPEGTFGLLVGILRYSIRVNCYTMVLTDTWPGFSLDNPGATY